MIEYKLAEMNDIDQLVDLRLQMQLEANGMKLEQVSLNYKDEVRSYFLRTLPNQKYLSCVAVHHQKIIGTAGICFYEKPPSIIGGSGLVGYVTNVFVETEYRKKGIGTRLMTELNRIAVGKNADKLHLGATRDGLSIYKSVGYKVPRFVSLEIKFDDSL